MSVRSPWCSQARLAPPSQSVARLHERCNNARPSSTAHRAQRAPGGGTAPPPHSSRPRQRAIPAAAAAAAAGGRPKFDDSEEVLLLDLLLPAPPDTVALALFGTTCGSSSGSSSSSSSSSSSATPPAAAPHGLLVQHMQQALGCTGMAAQPWQPAGAGGGLRRRLHYATPLSRRQRLLLPFGPAAVPNTEEQRLSLDGSGGVRLSSSVATEGVPFADSFTNRLEWQLLPLVAAEDGSSSGSTAAATSTAAGATALAPCSRGSGGRTRLLLTARCAFHKRVLGPLRGQIQEQSLQGMRDAYSRLAPLFQKHFSSRSSSGITNALKASCLSSSSVSGATGPGAAEKSIGSLGGSSAAGDSGSGSGSEAAWATAQAAVRQHMPGPTAADCLLQAEALWPAWSAAACRLQPGQQAAGAEPSPDEAAAALQAVARRALTLPPGQRQQELAKARCVRGLVEALRLLPPRHAAASGSPPSGGGGPHSAGAAAAALWALAVLGGSIWWEPEAEALCALLPTRQPSSLRQASDAAWALATMRHCTPHLQLLEEAGAAALQRQLEHLAAAGAAPAAEPGGTSSSEAGSSSRQQAQARAPSLSQLASLVWGMATLGHHPVRLLPLMPPALRCQDAPPSFTAVCTIAWSLAVAGCLQHPAADAVAAALANAAEGLASAGAKKAALLQLHQFCLALQLSAEQAGGVGGDGAGTALNLLRQHAGMQPLLAASATAWEAEGRYRGSKQVSAAQADVAATARGLGLAVQEELAVAGFSVDIAVPSQRLALEVDGPTHFARNAEGSAAPQPLGATLLKRRLLRQEGWAVVSINAARWEQLRSAAQKRAHLAAAIAEEQREAPGSTPVLD